jgi:hypothetical protein
MYTADITAPDFQLINHVFDPESVFHLLLDLAAFQD